MQPDISGLLVVFDAFVISCWLEVTSARLYQSSVVPFGTIASCRFQKLDSCVLVMQSSQDCMGDDVSEAVDRAPGRAAVSPSSATPPIACRWSRKQQGAERFGRDIVDSLHLPDYHWPC
jgi:hypothetical protein